MKNIKKWQFYLLSFTWGLPMSIVGLLVFGVLMLFGYRPKKYGHSYYIPIGGNWGGLELGCFFIVGKPEEESIMMHELGHCYQNACLYGWISPILVIISACRYWLNRAGVKLDYYAWWYESQANKIGKQVMKG